MQPFISTHKNIKMTTKEKKVKLINLSFEERQSEEESMKPFFLFALLSE